MNRNMHAVVTEWSGMFSGTFRNVRTKAECGDTIPAGTTTEHVRNVQSARRGQRWRMCSCTAAGLNVTCWSFQVNGFTRNSKTTFIGILYTACIKQLIQGRWNFRVAFGIFKYLQITISVLEFWL